MKKVVSWSNGFGDVAKALNQSLKKTGRSVLECDVKLFLVGLQQRGVACGMLDFHLKPDDSDTFEIVKVVERNTGKCFQRIESKPPAVVTFRRGVRAGVRTR